MSVLYNVLQEIDGRIKIVAVEAENKYGDVRRSVSLMG